MARSDEIVHVTRQLFKHVLQTEQLQHTAYSYNYKTRVDILPTIHIHTRTFLAAQFVQIISG